MKPSGFIISAFIGKEERPVSFHFFEEEVEKELGDILDAIELIRNEPEYKEILFDLDLGFYMWYINSGYRINDIVDIIEYKVTEVLWE